MSNTKVIVDFTDYPAPELGTVARHIHTAITASAATFATLPFTLAVFDTLILDYEAKLAARKSKATNDILAFNAVRDVMEEHLATLGNHVNSVAKGDAVICGLSGFPTYTTGAAPDPSAPAAPTNVRLKHAGVAGSAIGRFKASRTPSTNEVQTSTGDPNEEASWSQYAIILGGKVMLSGFVPGTVVWMRVRTIGLAGVEGAWSDPAQIRML